MVRYSQHFLEQLEVRNIPLRQVEDALQNPDAVIEEDGLAVYQKQTTEGEKLYILRIFVNEEKTPPLAITAYKTSKIKKYGLL